MSLTETLLTGIKIKLSVTGSKNNAKRKSKGTIVYKK